MVIYTTPVSRANGADVIMLPTDLSAETGRAAPDQCCRGHGRGGVPWTRSHRGSRIMCSSSAGRARFTARVLGELLHMLRRDAVIIGGGATNRGVETSVREAFNLDIACFVVRAANAAGVATRRPTLIASTSQ